MANIRIVRSSAFILFCVFLVCGCEPVRKDPIDDEFPMAGRVVFIGGERICGRGLIYATRAAVRVCARDEDSLAHGHRL